MKRNKAFKVLPVLASALVLSLVAACGNSGTTKEANGSASPATTASVSKDPVKVTLWTPMNPNAKAVVKSLNELPMVQEWAKKTNVLFDFQHSSGNTPQDDVQQYGVMVASNNLPDSMLWNWNSVQGGTAKMFKDGTIIKLNDLIEKNAPNLKKILDANPQIAKQIKADNGDIYALPHLKVGEYGQYKTFSGMVIRQDWLEELGLQAPETVDEWEAVLRAFKEKKGVIPFTLNKSYPLSFADFAGAYGVAGMSTIANASSFYIDGGKVKFGPTQPEFKQYLTTMQKWYKEGLIDPDFASNDTKTMDAKITSGKAGAFYGFIGGSIGTYTPALQKTDPKAKLAAVQYPVLKKGDEPKFVQASWEYDNIGTVITSSNKHAAETVKAIDYLYSDEGAMLKNFGIEGQTYTKADGQPKYTDLILKNPDNLPISQAMAKYFIANYGFSGLDDDRYNDQYYQLQAQKDAVKLYAKYANNAYKVMLPPVVLSTDEAKESAKILNDVSTLLTEQITKVVMGTVKVEDYDKTMEQVKKMNIDRAVEIYQAATDRYNKR
ncbi:MULTISPECIES: ABC transporter substrate-binding protein [Paenibacillus]|uniref:ABC transporter substrate-binding protein n=1 Tax=Paenibacillus violae TaxID=3077234 RepID=A0ABU3REU4_9BACL|nr:MULTISPECIES: ABC transporter substrate-binding protein [Paenibacillus]MDU0202769.1 ABC transporter substrate-binding protein [Paenibacillus sp. PFR10]MEC0264262.1 ABC transporter substrate-binding protein [Paenibacillus anseongense]